MRRPWRRREPAAAPAPLRPALAARSVALEVERVAGLLRAAGHDRVADAVAAQRRDLMRFDVVRRDDIVAVHRPHADALRTHAETEIRVGVVHDHATVSALFLDGACSTVVATMTLPRSRVFTRLAGAGWTFARFVDPSADERALRELGCEVWPELRAFLSAFAGLRFGRDAFGTVRTRMDRERLERFEELAETDLAPVGGEDGHMVYLAGRDGTFYGEFDDLYRLGESPLEFVGRFFAPPTGVFVTVQEDGLRCEVERSRLSGAVKDRVERARRDGLRVEDLGIGGVAISDGDKRSAALLVLAADLRRLVRE
jgi:hypothetical protein